MPMDLLCRLQGENKRLKGQNDDLLAALQIVKEQRQHWWGKAVTRGAELFLRSSVVPCTYPGCLSARAVQAAGEEVEKLRGENANLRANVNGFTFCHSDEAVIEEMGRLRVEVEGAYHRGVKQGLLLAEAAAEEMPTTVSVHATAHDASVATRCKEAIVMAIGAVLGQQEA